MDCFHIKSVFCIGRRSCFLVYVVDIDDDFGVKVGRYSCRADKESGGKAKYNANQNNYIKNIA